MKALMTIKAPRGKATIYPVDDIEKWWVSRHTLAKKRTKPFNGLERAAYSRYVRANLRKKAMGVRAFMEEHKNDNGSSRPRVTEEAR